VTRAGFLDRWSRRKRAEPAHEPAPDPVKPAPDPHAPPSLSDEDAAQMTDAEALAHLRLPDPAALPHGADFSAFLRAGVPKRLQRMALRRLWAVSPEQAALDGLVDYAEDFTDAAVAVETLSTTYEVGRGLRAHAEALAQENEPCAEDDSEAPAADADPQEAAPPVAPRNVPEPPEPVQSVAKCGQNLMSEAPRRPRRMAFRFDDGVSGDSYGR
jgi:hypothetical protein